MYKWVYDKYIEEFKKKDKEELTQEILAMRQILCKDRHFIENYYSGPDIYDINALFMAINELRKDPSSERAIRRVLDYAMPAERSWENIQKALRDIKDPARVSKAIDEFKIGVEEAKKSNDYI